MKTMMLVLVVLLAELAGCGDDAGLTPPVPETCGGGTSYRTCGVQVSTDHPAQMDTTAGMNVATSLCLDGQNARVIGCAVLIGGDPSRPSLCVDQCDGDIQ